VKLPVFRALKLAKAIHEMMQRWPQSDTGEWNWAAK
jgi:hypothetical protein